MRTPATLRDRSVADQEPHKLPVPGSIPGPATIWAARSDQPAIPTRSCFQIHLRTIAAGRGDRAACFFSALRNAAPARTTHQPTLNDGCNLSLRGTVGLILNSWRRSARRFLGLTENRRRHRLAFWLLVQHPDWRLA